jgi:hypothetical protein
MGGHYFAAGCEIRRSKLSTPTFDVRPSIAPLSEICPLEPTRAVQPVSAALEKGGNKGVFIFDSGF